MRETERADLHTDDTERTGGPDRASGRQLFGVGSEQTYGERPQVPLIVRHRFLCAVALAVALVPTVKRVRLFANSISTAICEFPSTLFVNEFSPAKEETKIRWAMLAPFGDWPNKQGLQRVTKEDAQVIVNEFEKPANVLKRKVGIPFYIGHPDHPDFKERYKDTQAYGRIKEMEVRDDGLWAGIRFNSRGEQLIADEAFDGHSVNWFLRQDPKNKGVWRPFKVKSAGFTNEPNLPVPPITTANETQSDIFKRLAAVRLFANQSRAIEASFSQPITEKKADEPMQNARAFGAIKGAVVKHGTIKSRERFGAARDRATAATVEATNCSTRAMANGGKEHEVAKAAHALAADQHLEAGHRAKALGMDADASTHFAAANTHRSEADRHMSEMMNGGMDVDTEPEGANSRFKRMAGMRRKQQ